MIFLGSLIGFFVIPFVADNFGRRLAMRIAWGIGTAAVLLTSLADSPNLLGIGLFLVGFGTNPAITLCFSFINEVCIGHSRQKYGVGVQVAWAIGETSIALIFLTGLSWRAIMFILLGLFVVVGAAVELRLLETPMFLLKKQPK
jgi:MFS transporter, OCT family, solute carrier family 22 (organic cation transporter), member 4/5